MNVNKRYNQLTIFGIINILNIKAKKANSAQLEYNFNELNNLVLTIKLFICIEL